jgi:tetratricopeptide (TPR) repeat protein
LARVGAGRGRYALAIAALLMLAVDWSRASDWASPVTLFESAVQAYPRSARAQMELGSAYGAAGHGDEAIAAFARATAIKPDYAAAWYNLGNFYARGGQSDKAVESYTTALEFAPKLVPAWFNLGMVYRMTGRSADAAGAFANAVLLAPHAGDAQLAYGDTLLALGRNREAIEAYDAALETGVEPVAALINRGVAKQRLAGCAVAVDDYVEAVTRRPDHATALGNAVACLRQLGREPEADALIARSRSVANRHTGR